MPKLNVNVVQHYFIPVNNVDQYLDRDNAQQMKSTYIDVHSVQDVRLLLQGFARNKAIEFHVVFVEFDRIQFFPIVERIIADKYCWFSSFDRFRHLEMIYFETVANCRQNESLILFN